MTDLLEELSKMSGLISDLVKEEKEPNTRRAILELLIMVTDKTTSAVKYKGQKIENDNFQEAIKVIKETESLTTGYKQKSKTYNDLLDHVLHVMNKVEQVFFDAESPTKLLTINRSIKKYT